jgi:hypothetical protein
MRPRRHAGRWTRATEGSELPRPTQLAHARYVEGGASCFSDRTCRYLDCIRGLSTAVPVSAGVGFGPSRAYRFDGPVATRRRLHRRVFAFECRPWCRARHTLRYERLWHQASGAYPLPTRSLRSLAEEGALRLLKGTTDRIKRASSPPSPGAGSCISPPPAPSTPSAIRSGAWSEVGTEVREELSDAV